MAQININDFIDSNGNVIGSAKMIKDLVSSNNSIDRKTSLLSETTQISYSQSLVTIGAGSSSIWKDRVTKIGRTVNVSVAGSSTSGAGQKIFFNIPIGYRPEIATIAQIILATETFWEAGVVIIDPNGNVYSTLTSNLAGKAYHFNFTFSI